VPALSAVLAMVAAGMMVGSGASPAGAQIPCVPNVDRCELWSAERSYGDNWGSFGYVDAARNVVGLEDMLLVAEPVNEPTQSLEERYDFELVAISVEDGSKVWAAGYEGPADAWDIPYSTLVSPDEEIVYVTGMRDYPRTPNVIAFGGCAVDFRPASAITLAYRVADGTPLWASGLDEESSLDAAFGSALSPDGERLYVAGLVAAGTGDDCDVDFGVAALDTATGEEVWSTSIAGAAGGRDQGMTVEVTPDGTMLMATGITSAANGDSKYLTVGFDLPDEDAGFAPDDVSERWRSTLHGGPCVDERTFFFSVCTEAPPGPRGMVMAPDGETVFVTGETEHPGTSELAGPREYATVAYETATGAERWVARYRGKADGHTTPNGIAIDPGGERVFVTGFSVGDTEATWESGTVAYDVATGEELWAHTYPDLGAQGEGNDVAVAPDGRRVYVTGASDGDAATVAYDLDGNVLWTARFNPAVHGLEYAEAKRLVVSRDGEWVFVLGRAVNTTEDIRRQLDVQEDNVSRGYVWAYET
jgi:DNA-binding beta-propeller fold protein YncE